MSYSLLSRFEGCLWGVVLGEQAGKAAQTTPQRKKHRSLQHWHPQPRSNHDLPWSGEVLQQLQSGLRSPTWHQSLLAQSLLAQSHLSTNNSWPGTPIDAGRLAILTLPIALFYHDDLKRQRHSLEQQLDLVPGAAAHRDWVMAFAYAIAQAIKGQLEPIVFIDQLRAYLQVMASSDQPLPESINQPLQQIHRQNESGCGPWESTEADPNLAIAHALHDFLQTPDDIRLVLIRSAQQHATRSANTSAPLVCTLVGALAGAYNGAAAIPPSWRSTLSISASGHGAAIAEVAAALLAHWSGSYAPATLASPPTVAAPWVIQ
ncbi:MAG: ADP-ribosylglycohydrolase family protein [Leptolyngbyaceae cyanobacterium bins.349]|nr:ADP-ribosylglycohydrolase family protein [Leptolyngbyaceae cyanobacterium bins.349]